MNSERTPQLCPLRPAHLFLRIKMERAMQMLKATDMLAKEVGAYLGFDNQFHLSRAFKKTFGKTPAVMRGNRLSSS